MNVDDNRLIAQMTQEAEAQGFELLPQDLQHAAKTVLKGKPEATVSRTSGGKLSRHAAKRRKEKRKAARQARKRNR